MIPNRALYITLVFLLLGAVEKAGHGQAREPFGEVFKPVQSDFETALKNLPRDKEVRDEAQYDIKGVNDVLARTKAATLAKIPESDVPLRTYVESRFPTTRIPRDLDTSQSLARQALDSVKTLLKTLSRVPTVRLTLTITSTPPGARFELTATGGGSQEAVSTNDRINLYRGFYRYVVAKHGYKEIRGQIDLIEQTGDTFECDLQSNDQPSEAVLCRLR